MMTDYVKIVHKIAEFARITKYTDKNVNNVNLDFI